MGDDYCRSTDRMAREIILESLAVSKGISKNYQLRKSFFLAGYLRLAMNRGWGMMRDEG